MMSCGCEGEQEELEAQTWQALRVSCLYNPPCLMNGRGWKWGIEDLKGAMGLCHVINSSVE
jgi:hypothetical protein